VAGGRLGMLVQPAGVDEGLFDEVGFADREAQPFRERGGGSHDSRASTRG
jgi:hypothetical protein